MVPCLGVRGQRETTERFYAGELVESDLGFENHSGCYVDDVSWRQEQKLGYQEVSRGQKS